MSLNTNTLNLIELEYDISLPPKSVIVIRVTGMGMRKLFGKEGLANNDNREAMYQAVIETAKMMDNFIVAYQHSNEVSFVLTDDIKESTQPWLGNNFQGLISQTTSCLSANYSILLSSYKDQLKIGIFRAKTFELYPGAEIGDYINNRINLGVGRYISELYSKHLTGSNVSLAEAQKLLLAKGIEIKKEYMYGDIIAKPGLNYIRISPVDIGLQQINEFVENIITNKRNG